MISKLLIRPKPLMNESLASYMNRICNENLCKIEWILDPYKTNKKKLYKTLNKINDDEMISKITEITGLLKSETNNMTYNKFIIKNNLKEVIPPLWCDDVKCCPLCLKEKHYHQIHWQLKYIKICLKHNLILTGVCSCGKKIEINELIEGVCECGMELSKLKYSCNRNKDIYIHQYRIYKALNIEQKLRKVSLSGTVFCGLKKEKFLYLKYLMILLMGHIDKPGLLELSELYCMQLSKIDKMSLLLIEEKILNNYPNSLYILLDLLSNKWMNIPYIKKLNLIRINTPIGYLEFSMKGKLHELFHKEIHCYLITRYVQYNKKFLLFNKYARENDEYISIDVVEYGYLFPRSSIDSLFKTKIVDVTKYIEINEVLNFISAFIKRSAVFFDKDREIYIPLRQILDFFGALKFRLDIITSIILEKKIEIKVHICKRGLEMIYIHKDSAIKSIIQFILEVIE